MPNSFKQREWQGFVGGAWLEEINARDLIQRNYTRKGIIFSPHPRAKNCTIEALV